MDANPQHPTPDTECPPPPAPSTPGGIVLKRNAVFLDRDGVINARRPTLVRRWSQFRFLPSVFGALERLAATDYAIVVATNQEWVDWGYISRQDHDHVHQRMVEEISVHGGRVDRVYACTHRPSRGCACRKPKPGMLIEAAKDLDLDLAGSWFIGDNRKDMVAGREAGVKTALVDPRWRTRRQHAEDHADIVASDLGTALDHILRKPVIPRAADSAST